MIISDRLLVLYFSRDVLPCQPSKPYLIRDIQGQRTLNLSLPNRSLLRHSLVLTQLSDYESLGAKLAARGGRQPTAAATIGLEVAFLSTVNAHTKLS
jgi:hypothetical protein